MEDQIRLYLFVQNYKLLIGRITYRRIHYVFTKKSTSISLDIFAFGLTNNSFIGRIRIYSVWTIQLFVWTKLVLFGRISFLFGRITFSGKWKGNVQIQMRKKFILDYLQISNPHKRHSHTGTYNYKYWICLPLFLMETYC